MSYGQGSSREHAAICPSHLGVRAVITKSFERIHSANLINFGIVPLLFANEADFDRIDQGDGIEIPEIREAITRGATVRARNVTKGFEFEVRHTLTGRQIEIILAGGRLAYTKEKGAF
jgi:aconitate hydratase